MPRCLSGLRVRDLGETRRIAILSQLDNTPTVPVDEAIIQDYARLTADARARGDALAGRAQTADRWVPPLHSRSVPLCSPSIGSTATTPTWFCLARNELHEHPVSSGQGSTVDASMKGKRDE